MITQRAPSLGVFNKQFALWDAANNKDGGGCPRQQQQQQQW